MTNLGLRALNHPILKAVFKTPWVGIYNSYDEAARAIPPVALAGYNNLNVTEGFKSWPVDRVRPADYAFMMHLRGLLRPQCRLVDLGGAIGMSCYTAQKYFPLPDDFEWIVCDVPAMLSAAKEVAVREGAKSVYLRFIDDLNLAGRCDIFASSGALHFINSPLPTLLAKLDELPKSVLINRIPVWDKKAYVTLAILHNIDNCLTPYQIFNQEEFVGGMEAVGYKLIDSWICPESTFSVRFHPSTRLNAFRGFYFSLQ
jgi:putative methyltransferase (TIGR04325 family)